MSGTVFEQGELCFLADEAGDLIGYQEAGASWTSLLAFSNEQRALAFRRDSGLLNCAVVALDLAEESNLRNFIAHVKRRAVRSLLVDLDFNTGHCSEVGFIGQSLTAPVERQVTPAIAGPIQVRT